jgi:hypothetical protein
VLGFFQQLSERSNAPSHGAAPVCGRGAARAPACSPCPPTQRGSVAYSWGRSC